MVSKNPYDILGIHRGAHQTEVEARYREIMSLQRPYPGNDLADARRQRITRAYEQLTRTFGAAVATAALPKPGPSAALAHYIAVIENKMPRLEKLVERFETMTRGMHYTIHEACGEYETNAGGLRGAFGRHVVTGERRRALNRLKAIDKDRVAASMKTALAYLKSDLDKLPRPDRAAFIGVTKIAIDERLSALEKDLKRNTDLFLDARAVLSGRREKLLLDEKSPDAVQTIRSVNARNPKGPR